MTSASRHMDRRTRNKLRDEARANLPKATPGARRLRKHEGKLLLQEWKRDLRQRGYNPKSVAQLSNAAFAIFKYQNAKRLSRGVEVEEVFHEGFLAGVRSIEFATKEARQGELTQVLADEMAKQAADLAKPVEPKIK